MFKLSYASPLTGVLSKSLGSWQGQKIIAIGPKGGKIIGYSKGEPIYAGSAKAQQLVQHKAAAKKHADEGVLEKLGAVIGDWLSLLGLKPKATEGDLIALSFEDAAEVVAQFGVTGKPMAGHVAFNAKALAEHVGKTFSPKVGEELATLAALAAGAFGDEAPWQPAQLAKMKIQGGAGGSHGHTFNATDGATEAIWKTGDATIYRAEEAASRIAQLVFPNPALYAKGAVVTLGSKTGVLLTKIKGKTGNDAADLLGPESGHKVDDARLQKHAVRLIQHQVFDWLIDNHDAHAGNFIETPSGDLGAFDNGQAWRFMVEGKTEELSDSYNPNHKSEGLAAQQVWLRWKAGKVKLDEGEVVKAVEEVLGNIATLSAEQYEQIIAPYFAQVAPTKIKKAVERFQNMRADWEKFLSTQFKHKVTLTPKVQGVVEAAPALTVVEAPKPAPKPKAVKPTAPAVTAPQVEPSKLVVQVPGWPKKKGNVTVHNPGGPPPPGTSWPAKYPGPGYVAVVTYKGTDYRFTFKTGADGNPAIVVEKKPPSGEGWGLAPIYIAKSIQQAADIPYLHVKGLPLHMSSSEKAKKHIGYSAMKLFQIEAFSEDFKQVSTLAVSPASESVQTLEAEKKVEPEKKKLTHFDMLMEAGATGLVLDSALLPVEVQDFVKASKVTELPTDWNAPPPGTVWASPPGDLESGGSGQADIFLTTVQVDALGKPAYSHWAVTPEGKVILAISGTDGSEPVAQTFKNNAPLLAAAAKMKKVAAPVGPSPEAVQSMTPEALPPVPPVGAKVSSHEELEALGAGSVVEDSNGDLAVKKPGGWWQLKGDESGTDSPTAALVSAAQHGGPLIVKVSKPNWQTMPEGSTAKVTSLAGDFTVTKQAGGSWKGTLPSGKKVEYPNDPPEYATLSEGVAAPTAKIEVPSNAPKHHPGPLASGTTVKVTKKGLGEVQLHVEDDGTFTVAFIGKPGAATKEFKSLSAACDHVWVVQQGFEDATAYKKAKGVNKVPSGGGWKFWGLKAAPEKAPPAPAPAPVAPPAPVPAPVPAPAPVGKDGGAKHTVGTKAELDALPVGSVVVMQAAGKPYPGSKGMWIYTKQPGGDWLKGNGHKATSSAMHMHAGIADNPDENYLVTKLGPTITPIVPDLGIDEKGAIVDIPTAKSATPASTKPVPKVVTILEDVPSGAKQFVQNTWIGVEALTAKSLPNGKTPAQKSPLWPEWVPPPGLVLEAEVEGKKLFMTTSAGGYLNNGSPAAAPQFTIWDANGVFATQMANADAIWTLANAFHKWHAKSGAFGAPPMGEEVWKLFHLDNAAYPANSTFAEHTPPAASAVITTAPEDIPESEKGKLVTKKLPLGESLANATVLAKYGLNPESGKPPKLYTSAVKTNKWGDGQSYISINAAKSSKVDWSAKLKQVLADHGILAQITAGPNASDFGGAYAVVPTSLLTAVETAEVVTVEEAAQAAPDPVPTPWPEKGAALDEAAFMNAPSGTKLTYLGQTYVKVEQSWHKLVDGKLEPLIMSPSPALLASYVTSGAGVTASDGTTVKPDTSGSIPDEKEKKAHPVSVEALNSLAPGSIINNGFTSYQKQVDGQWQSLGTSNTFPASTFQNVPITVVSQPKTELKPQQFSKDQLDKFPPGAKLFDPVEDDTYVMGPNGLWSSKKYGTTIYSQALANTNLIVLAPGTAPTAAPEQPSLPKKLLKSSTKELLKQQLQALPVGTKLTFANGSYLEKMSNGWALDGKSPWINHYTATYIKHTGSVAVTAPGMATPPLPAPAKPKPAPKPKPVDPAKLAAQQAAVAKAKAFVAWNKTVSKPTKPATLQALSFFQNDPQVAVAGSAPKLYAYAQDDSLLIGAPDYDALKKSIDNWTGFPPYEEVDAPFGKLLKVPEAKLKKLFPNIGMMKGPDGKDYPKGTTFEQKQVVDKTKGELLGAEPNFHKFAETPGDDAKQTVKWKFSAYSTDDEKQAAKATVLAVLAKHGITPAAVIVGSANVVTTFAKADLTAPGTFKTDTVADIPPQPPTFKASTPPISIGKQEHKAVGIANHADLGMFDAIVPSGWGHRIRLGDPGVLRGSNVCMKKVKKNGETFVEVFGDLTDFKGGTGLLDGKHFLHVSTTPSKGAGYLPDEGVHAGVPDTKGPYAGKKGKTSSGNEFTISTENGSFKNHFVLRVPVGSDYEAELRDALTQMVGAEKAERALMPHDADMERIWIKSEVVRAGIGPSGFWDEDAFGKKLDTTKYGDEQWLDQQLDKLGLAEAAKDATIEVGPGGVQQVVMSDMDLAGVAYVSTGLDSGSVHLGDEWITEHLGIGEGIAARRQGYVNGTSRVGGTSPSADDYSGAAYGLPTRVVPHGAVNSGWDYECIFHPRVLQRTGWYWHSSDSYGSTSSSFHSGVGWIPHGGWGAAKNARKKVETWAKGTSSAGSNEAYFVDGIVLEDVMGIKCNGESDRAKILATWKKRWGDSKPTVNGVPVEEFFFVGDPKVKSLLAKGGGA